MSAILDRLNLKRKTSSGKALEEIQEETIEDFLKLAKAGDVEALQKALKQAKSSSYTNPQQLLNASSSNGKTAIQLAAELGHIKAVGLLVDQGADYSLADGKGKTPLHYAATSQNEDMIRYMLTLPSMKDVPNENNDTALHYLAKNPCTTTDLLPEIISLFHKCGSDFNLRNTSGVSPLHSACLKGYDDMVQQLVTYRKVDVNIRNDRGETPLHWASRKGSLKAVKSLLTAGADPTLSGMDGTALDLASNDEVKNLLTSALLAKQQQLHSTQSSPARLALSPSAAKLSIVGNISSSHMSASTPESKQIGRTPTFSSIQSLRSPTNNNNGSNNMLFSPSTPSTIASSPSSVMSTPSNQSLFGTPQSGYGTLNSPGYGTLNSPGYGTLTSISSISSYGSKISKSPSSSSAVGSSMSLAADSPPTRAFSYPLDPSQTKFELVFYSETRSFAIVLTDESWIETLEKMGQNVPGLKAEEHANLSMSQLICRYMNEIGGSVSLIPIYLSRYLSGKSKNALLQLNQTSAFTLRTLSVNNPMLDQSPIGNLSLLNISNNSSSNNNNNNNNNNINNNGGNNNDFSNNRQPLHNITSFSWESLNSLYNDLLIEERLKEALSLRQHMEVLEQIAKAEKMYENSKQEDRLEEALEIRKIVERLQKKLTSDMEIRRWASPPPKSHLTIAQITNRIHQSNNSVTIAKWNAKYEKIRLTVVAQTDLEKALDMQRKTLKWMAKKLQDQDLLEEFEMERQRKREHKEKKKRQRSESNTSTSNQTRDRSGSNLSNSSRSTLASVSTLNTIT